jgi:hypothetical protein
LKDVYPHEDQNIASKNVKFIATWLESLPISKLPYVEMGFDTLATDLIQKIDNHQNLVKNNYENISLKCRNSELINMYMIYQEHFPFWSSPYSEKTATDYKVGDRVMNINSTKREYIPFGFRGTVVGRTNENVLVLFDE